MNLYGRLFKYRQREGQSPLENYLTEGFCDLLNRIGEAEPQTQAKLLTTLFGYNGNRPVDFQTQYQIKFESKSIRPDLAGFVENKCVLLIEVKINAGYTDGTGPEGKSSEICGEEAVTSIQLENYGNWLRAKHPAGRLVLLTHTTSYPSDFRTSIKGYGVSPESRHVQYWSAVYNALRELEGNNTVYGTLCKEFCDFLQEVGIVIPAISNETLDQVDSFLKNKAAANLQSYMNSLREHLKTVASRDGMPDFSWEVDRLFQYGGQVIENHTIIGWVWIKDKCLQISWGFYFYREDEDPFCFEASFGIPAVSGIFMNIMFNQSSTSLQKYTAKGEDWYPALQGKQTRAPSVAFKARDAFKNSDEITSWFEGKFREACTTLKESGEI